MRKLTRADFEVLLGLLRNILELVGAPVSVVSDSVQHPLLPLQLAVHLLHISLLVNSTLLQQLQPGPGSTKDTLSILGL